MTDDGHDKPQVLSFDVPPGARMEFTNGTRHAQLYTFDCGDFGTISFTVPIGASFTFKPGTIVPTISINDAPFDISHGDNIVRIDKPD